MTVKTTTAAEVEIFGSVYSVRGDKDPEHLQELARLVDQRMKEIAKQVSTVDSAKIAILAALNIADDLFHCRKRQEGDREKIEERVTELTGELDQALKG
ncbi:MAG: cell division protein ZapA [Thermoanaerobaculia bacterium]|nr:cell division protein ZapA [Thermoanaerobaculia bacterium]